MCDSHQPLNGADSEPRFIPPSGWDEWTRYCECGCPLYMIRNVHWCDHFHDHIVSLVEIPLRPIQEVMS